jgi:hypothetical protein
VEAAKLATRRSATALGLGTGRQTDGTASPGRTGTNGKRVVNEIQPRVQLVNVPTIFGNDNRFHSSGLQRVWDSSENSRYSGQVAGHFSVVLFRQSTEGDAKLDRVGPLSRSSNSSARPSSLYLLFLQLRVARDVLK